MAYNNRGVAYRNKGKFDEAITDCSEAIRLGPNFAHFYNNRGLAYEEEGEQAKAEADFAKAKELGYEPE